MTCSPRRCPRPTGRSRSATSAALGDRLAQEGYLGFFEVDVLMDTDTGAVYLGELNPRISGASSMTKRHRGRLRRRAAVPVPPARVHGRRLHGRRGGDQRPAGRARWPRVDVWSQLIMKEARRRRRAHPGGPAHRRLAPVRRRARSSSSTSPMTGTRSPPRTTPSSCASTARVTSSSTVPTWASSSPRAACRRPRGLTERCRRYIEGHPRPVQVRTPPAGAPPSCPSPTSK